MRQWIRGGLAVAAISTVAVQANAEYARGFAINRFEPSARGSEWFVLDTLDLGGALRPAFGVVGEWARDPLVIYKRDGSVGEKVVSDQLVFHLGGSINLFDKLRVNLDLPLYAYATGDGGTLEGVRYNAPSSSTTFGDIRLGADVKLAGAYRSAVSIAGGLDLWIPTATEGSYSSEGSARFGPHVIAAGEVGMFLYSAKLGFTYRNRDEAYAGSELGSELTYAASAGVRIPDSTIVVGPEIYGRTVASSFFGKRATPLEGLLGTHIKVGGGFRFVGGIGIGLSRGFGSPATRLVLGLEWAPELDVRKDSDGSSTDKPQHGRPAVAEPEEPAGPPDRDKDGVPDDTDACPDAPGLKSDDPKNNGCSDNDGDGILDHEDACPDVHGVASEDGTKHGCPEDPDRDKDGIANAADACPDEPGQPHKDPPRNGCPSAFIKGGQIRILDPVKFVTNTSTLEDSDAILEAIKAVLVNHPEILKVRIEAHTDNRGKAAANQKLTDGQAKSVVDWLVSHGVAADRLTGKGFGQDRPISENSSEEGRADNRRVELYIEQEKSQ